MKSQQKSASASASTPPSSARMNALALLKADHRKVNALFGKYKSAGSAEEKSSLARQVCTELIVHTRLEEEIFYPACREAGVEDAALDEAQVEHDSAKVLMAGLLHNQPDSPFYDARMAVLTEYIKHHVAEEEKPGGIFARARAARLDMNALGLRLQERKEELMARAGKDELSPSAPGSLELQSIDRGNQQEQFTMARQYDRSRDAQGRFDDDERDGRGYAARTNERDARGRFMSDDERSGGRSWRDEQSGYSSRDSGGRGWYGDPEGHSRASGQGWENRGGRSGSSRHEEDDRGGRGYSSQSNERDERGRFISEDERAGGRSSGGEDYRYSSRGEDSRGRGWFGDPEGHARASEEGWESRGRSRSSPRDEDDYRSGRGSREGRGHGGWFGDSRAHSEASRRGWQNR